MFLGNLSQNSQHLLKMALTEADFLNHFYLGTEHLFIALCKTDDQMIQSIFGQFSIDPLIRREIRESIMVGESTKPEGDIVLTPRLNHVLETAEDFRKGNQLSATEPIHLFLALLQAGDGVAVRMLRKKGVEIDRLSAAIRQEVEKSREKKRVSPSASKTPLLNQIGRDLTFLAHQGKLDPVIGREEEIRKLGRILTMKKKNNPVLIGEAGVGKTAVVEGFALRLAAENVAPALQGLRIIEVSLAALIAGTKFRGDFEQRVQNIIDEAKRNPAIVLFIDEMHTMLGAGSASGSLDAANILKPVLARGEIRCIGATTIEEYRRHIEKDAALERRFHPVMIEEPGEEDTLKILKGLKEVYQTFYQLNITDAAIDAAVKLSVRYLPDRKLPDKAIDLIDQASAKKKLKTLSPASQHGEGSYAQLTEEDIAKVVAEWTGIPVDRLTEREAKRLRDLETILGNRVIGQEKAVEAVADTIRVGRSGLGNPNRPLGVFMFMGPTGVGKTELAKALAEFLFDDERRLIRFDMSEYMESHSIAKLIGSPPGYIGHEQEGQLAATLRTHPYSVILLDEIEKAHPDIFNIFLQIFDEGWITDARGKKIDFKNTIIIMTSNIGSGKPSRKPIGFVYPQEDEISDEVQSHEMETLLQELQKTFQPEFLGRIDKIIEFRPLKQNELRLIVNKFLKQVRNRLSNHQLSLEISDDIFDFLIQKGFSEKYGAREMERVVQRFIVEPLSRRLLEGEFKAGETVHIRVDGEDIVFRNQ